jgi:hypothetical protein
LRRAVVKTASFHRKRAQEPARRCGRTPGFKFFLVIGLTVLMCPQVLFYLLLLFISEHLGFAAAYVIAATARRGLTT